MNRHDTTAGPGRPGRTLTDHAGEPAGPGATAGRPGSSAEAFRGIPSEVAAVLIREIYAVGLTVESCAQMVSGPAARRLATAVDDLDAIICDVRRAVFNQLSAAGGYPSARSGADGDAAAAPSNPS